MLRIPRPLPLGLALATCLLAAAPAGAATKFTIRGAGFGHGVGMSQYGAMGYAEHGASYDAILGHYYTDTALGTASPTQPVRVLLQSAVTATFSGASRAGNRTLSAGRTYRVRPHGTTQVDLLKGAKVVKTFTAPLQVAGADGTLATGGRRYRGTLSFTPGALGGVDVIDTLGLDDYVRGVVSLESPASWPLEALKAQAVAARTYAITTHRSGSFDQYADTRSQMYGGASAETATTDRAVAATRGQVVTYDGHPVTTYFFSTSGGRTENVEDSVLGGSPQPWLKSVEDPYDSVSPRHRWGPTTMTRAQAGAKLSGLVRGSFRGIVVRRRGVSPRIVTADVVGTRGRTRVSGATLRARFGLYDTWAYFTSIGLKATPKAKAPKHHKATAPNGTGGVSAARRGVALSGTVLPAHRGAEVQVQLRRAGHWATVGSATVDGAGRYRAAVSRRGTYRVLYWGDAGPSTTVR
jgi:stage II sporulation protein D